MSQRQTADVGLILEGTYPYVLGGVSAWVDQIIRGLPDITFAIYFIGSKKADVVKQHYQLPPNVISLTELYLHDPLPPEEFHKEIDEVNLKSFYKALENFYLANSMHDRRSNFWLLLDELEKLPKPLRFENLNSDLQAWRILEKACTRYAPSVSFIDFFWTIRFLHLPVWALIRDRKRVPLARVYHSVSAGYAGLVGAMAARARNVPYILTEHGIYTKERIAEIAQADWIFEGDVDLDPSVGLGKLKQLWINFFLLLGQIAYDISDPIITLYEGNVYTQIEFGADSSKCRVIPNGIDPEKFNAIRTEVTARWTPEPSEKIIGFIGRIVPIKDVKTLIRAARLVCEKAKDVKFLVAGPYTEDPVYFEECTRMVKLLELEGKVVFMGMQKLMEVLPKMDVMVLTSISEGLPLVVLEAFAAGIPCVSTDVGACRELIFGRTQEDKELGRAGRITKILSPHETAAALLALIKNADQWQLASKAGRIRVEKYYRMSILLETYRKLYKDLAIKKP